MSNEEKIRKQWLILYCIITTVNIIGLFYIIYFSELLRMKNLDFISELIISIGFSVLVGSLRFCFNYFLIYKKKIKFFIILTLIITPLSLLGNLPMVLLGKVDIISFLFGLCLDIYFWILNLRLYKIYKAQKKLKTSPELST